MHAFGREGQTKKIWAQRDARPYSISICDYANPKIKSRPRTQSANVSHFHILILFFVYTFESINRGNVKGDIK